MLHPQHNGKCGFTTKHKLILFSFCEVGIKDSIYIYKLCDAFFPLLNIIESYSHVIFTFLSKQTPISQWKKSTLEKQTNKKNYWKDYFTKNCH